MNNEKNAQTVTVICAKVTNPILTGYFTGFKCIRCQEELQATAKGRDMIKKGAYPLCNKCGVLLVEQRMKDGKEDSITFSQEVIRQMKERESTKHSHN